MHEVCGCHLVLLVPLCLVQQFAGIATTTGTIDCGQMCGGTQCCAGAADGDGGTVVVVVGACAGALDGAGVDVGGGDGASAGSGAGAAAAAGDGVSLRNGGTDSRINFPRPPISLTTLSSRRSNAASSSASASHI